MHNDAGMVMQQYALHLGIWPQATVLQQLELQSLPAQNMHWQGSTIQCAFMTPYCPDEDRNSRLVALLQQLLTKMPGKLSQQIVYLLLPEFDGPDNPQLNALLQQIMRSCPQLLQSEQCRVFPYGSAASLMAVNAVQQHFTQQSNSQSSGCAPVWLVAVDSLCSAAVFERYQQSSHVLSEGAIALCLSWAENGVKLQLTATDAVTGKLNGTDDVAIASVFRQVAEHIQPTGQRLNLVYLPDCGDDDASALWLAQYQWLHGAVNSDTAYCMPSYYSGELGACGGLYRLLHLMQAQQKGRLSGLTLAYEQSAKQYRSAAVFASAGLAKE